MSDRIKHLTLSHVVLPLENPVSDAKVLTGRQKPLTETVLLFVGGLHRRRLRGNGVQLFQACRRPAQYAHLCEVADVVIGQDPSDIDSIYQSLLWAGASVGRSGAATQAIAALDVALWDLKARRAALPLAKLLGAHRDSCRVYNTSGGFLQASVEEIKEKATASLESGIGGIKIKVGQPDWQKDLERVAAHSRSSRRRPADGRRQPAVGPGPGSPDVPRDSRLRPDVDRGTARRVGRRRSRRPQPHLRHPDRHRRDAHLGTRAHGADRRRIPWHRATRRTPDRRASPRSCASRPSPRTPGLALAPHYAMEIHLHLAAAYPTEPWVEHFEWLNPLFNERIDIHDGRMWLPGACRASASRSVTRCAPHRWRTSRLRSVMMWRDDLAGRERWSPVSRTRSSPVTSRPATTALGNRTDRRVRRVPHRGARSGHPAAGRRTRRNLPGPWFIRARRARTHLVHRRVRGHPDPTMTCST